jgi:subtilisin family serine protease
MFFSINTKSFSFDDLDYNYAEIYIDENGELKKRNSKSNNGNSERVIAKGIVNKRYAMSDNIKNLSQWYGDRLEYDKIHKISTGKDVIIAVIDSGVDKAHPDLEGQVLSGIDLIDRNNDGGIDPNGHGTHVAGIIAAKKNDFGITGLAYNAKILPVRVLDEYGEGNDADIAFGILWAEKNGAKIINLSLGGTKEDPLLRDAIAEVVKNGVVVIAASGNTGDNKEIFYPAANPFVVATASTDLLDKTSFFSTRGDYVDISAPGSMILSTTNGFAYKTDSGTSMATPFVSATIALLLSQGFSNNTAIEKIYNTAYDIELQGKDELSGYGLIDPYTALTSNQPRVKNNVNIDFEKNKKDNIFPVDNKFQPFYESNNTIINNKIGVRAKSYISITGSSNKKVVTLYAKNITLAYRKLNLVGFDVHNNKYTYNIRTNGVGTSNIYLNKKIINFYIKYDGDNLTEPAKINFNLFTK